MKPFLQRDCLVSVPPLRLPGARTTPALSKLAIAGLPPEAAETGSHVEVVKEGDRVVRLVVTCGCGERVEINCLYAAGA